MSCLNILPWSREVARLAIGSLDLEPSLGRRSSESLSALGWESDVDEQRRVAAALGYAAHVTHHLAGYLGVPLRYPIVPASSRSTILDCHVAGLPARFHIS